MVFADAPDEILQQLCRDLHLMWRQAGGPTLRKLSDSVRLGKSQVGAILNGDIRRLPPWDVVRALVNSFREYAEEHDSMKNLSLRTGVNEFWRPRYTVLEHAFMQAQRPRTGAGPVAKPAIERVVPRQLPPAVAHLAGRAAELDTLDSLIDRLAGSASAAVICSIGGMAGIGKTALAVSWAHRVRSRFPDGQLYVDLRGFTPGGSVVSPDEAVRGFLDAFAVAPQRVPAGLDARVALYRSLLAGKRILVVLDNARDAEQVRPLLPGTPGCVAVITSRDQLTALVAAVGVQPLTLDVLTDAEAGDMLARRIGPDRLVTEPAATRRIIASCARLPLALAIAAARATSHPGFPLAALAAELAEAQARLDILAADEQTTNVRAVFSWSYRDLTTAAARLFRLLGLHPGPDISIAATASLAGQAVDRVRPLLAELTRTNLIVEHAPGRYTFHDLLRAYAAEQAHNIEPEDQRRAAIRRALDHYLHTAYAAAVSLDPHRDPITLAPPQPGTSPENPADHEHALAWFTAEHSVLLATVDQAADDELHTHAVQLAWTLTDFLYRQGHWHDLAVTQCTALAAARRLADSSAQARTHRFLAAAYTCLSRFSDARQHLRCALDLYQQAGDHTGQANTYRSLSLLHGRQGRHAAALEYSRQALDLYQAADHRDGQARALNGIGWCHAQLGDHRPALIACHQALTLYEQLDDVAGQAATWDSLGYAHLHLSQHSMAITCYQRALALFRLAGDRYQETRALTLLGDTHHTTGNTNAARTTWQEALAILDELGHSDADQVRARLTVLGLGRQGVASIRRFVGDR